MKDAEPVGIIVQYNLLGKLEGNRLLFYLNVYNWKSLARPSNFRQVSDSDDDHARSRLHYLHGAETPFRCATPFDVTVSSVGEYLGLNDLLKIHE